SGSKVQVWAQGSCKCYKEIEGLKTKQNKIAEDDSFLKPRVIRWIPRDMQRFPDFYANMYERMGLTNRFRTRMCVRGPLRLKTLEPVKRDLQIFKNALSETGSAEGFFCVTAPAWTEEFLWNEYYRSDDEMVVALSEQMAPIYKAVVDAGVLLQIDDPAISHDWEEVR